MGFKQRDPARNGQSGSSEQHPHALSIIAPGTTLVGDLQSEGVLKIEGCIEGRVRGQEQVLIARGGLVKGDVETAEALIAGEIRGNVIARDRVELQAGCVVHGDVTAPKVVILEGGELNGHLKMGESIKATPKPVAAA